MNHTKELVINYFITERCNFCCQFCFSTWDKRVCCDSPILDDRKRLLTMLYDFFHHKSRINPIAKTSSWERVRINFSGGEPLLAKDTLDLISYAYTLGFDVSITTNGSLLTEPLIYKMAPYLIKIGFSIDSLCKVTNKSIGSVQS